MSQGARPEHEQKVSRDVAISSQDNFLHTLLGQTRRTPTKPHLGNALMF
jgi:hypothetical protein